VEVHYDDNGRASGTTLMTYRPPPSRFALWLQNGHVLACVQSAVIGVGPRARRQSMTAPSHRLWIAGTCAIGLAFLFAELFDRWSRRPTPTWDARALAMTALRSFQDVDLRRLAAADSQRVIRAIETVMPGRQYQPAPDMRWSDCEPRRVWKFQESQERPAWALLDAGNTHLCPGTTNIRIALVTQEGACISETRFTTGWRQNLREVQLQSRCEKQYPLIVFRLFAAGSQYYARIGDRFDLIRLEDNNGKAVRNGYLVKHYQCGPDVPQQIEAKWESDLCGSDHFKVLRALVWIGGAHRIPASDQPPKPDDESVSDIQLVRRVRCRPRVVARLRELTHSRDQWEQEQAILALCAVDSEL
jgi:hypothetical protein